MDFVLFAPLVYNNDVCYRKRLNVTLLCSIAGLSVPNASSVALLLNSGIPKTGVYSGIRVGSVAICCFIFRIRGSHVVCPCSPKYSGHKHKYLITNSALCSSQ